MRLLFFTPVSKRSAIGRMASLVVPELVAQGHDVTVIRTESPGLRDEPTHGFDTPVTAWNDFEHVRQLAATADLCIYQIGDNYEFHEGCLHWMPAARGIVCLHDFFIGHLFCGWAQSRPVEARTILQHWYGEEIAERFFAYTGGNAFIDRTRDAAPMTEWVCAMALGVVTHSSWGCDRVLTACPGPVSVVPLPYDAPAAHMYARRLHGETGGLQVLTIGHVNPNKRVESVIKAIGSSATLRDNITYKLVGHVAPEMVLSLSHMARSYGVNLVIAGEVDDTALAQAIAETDVVSCLRWPTLEAASASAIEATLYGKAVICTDAGFYSEIPDEYVLKVSVDNEIDDIAANLTTLIHDPEQIRTIGEKARRWAADTFSAAVYARSLTEMARRALTAKPVIDACYWISEMAARWSPTMTNPLCEEDLAALEVFSGHREANIASPRTAPQADDLQLT
ncbi:glycosyltransferase family 4 protein [Burkholderia dolosa]|uniref:glycosyltransferase family 4 protein n=1 Tax=Burkholderia dolosa TaxID=152500 RepID=UPI001B9570AE|nr:glycosyltransferase family 4 protein [Burkholderia dolosa]MBR8455846.1 glycosyltransferase family 4 protein [Burkholderia dolosa]MDN7420284.1 glycosyltransferase family 4 protein [Burkholderia dolosa]